MRIRALLLSAIVVVYTFGLFAPPLGFALAKPVGPTSKREYWLNSRKPLSDKDPRYAFAHTIFSRVLSAADKRPGPSPELLILDEGGYPWARSLPDGTVLLTRGAIDICMKTGTRTDASAKLAFIIGHELSHLVNGDFWHFFFYQGASADQTSDPADKKALREVVDIAKKTDSVLAKELKADQYGVIYASQAGYNVRRIVDVDVNFFREWAMATSPALLEGDILSIDHPLIRQRSTTVLLTLKRVAKMIEVFDKGVESYKLKSYVIAKKYFEDFLSAYQSREAYNNLGLVYYQMAYAQQVKMKESDPAFRLSLIIDPYTRAKETIIRRKSFVAPFSHTMERIDRPVTLFTKYANTAARYFREAIERDYMYSPAHNNLACVHFLKGEFSSAVGQLDLSLLKDPINPEAYNNRAVAYMGLSKRLNVNLNQKIESDMKNAIKLQPDYLDAIFNLAYFYKITGRTKEKREYLAKLVKLTRNTQLISLLR